MNQDIQTSPYIAKSGKARKKNNLQYIEQYLSQQYPNLIGSRRQISFD